MLPRFFASSPEALIAQARVAQPPVADGERAELQLPSRSVLLQSSVVDDANTVC
jgi:hypothetical protein